MIKSIQSLKGFGVFNEYNHKNDRTEEFRKFNLIYGWNGSGKSTLSHLFRCIENKTTSTKFTSSEFSIIDDNGVSTTQDSVAQADLNIYTFNQDFISANISWNAVVESILLVDEENIEGREQLGKLKSLQIEEEGQLRSIVRSIEEASNEISKIESECSKDIKEELHAVGKTDSKYLSYNKRNFKIFMEANAEATKSAVSVLTSNELEELKKSAESEQKGIVSLRLQPINKTSLLEHKNQVENLVRTSVLSQTIQRLADNAEINKWVEIGLKIHKATKNCEFCGNTITDKRMQELEAHFSDSYKDLQEKLRGKVDLLESEFMQAPSVPEETDLYAEFKSDYREARISLEKAYQDLWKEVLVWCNALKNKINNPLDKGQSVDVISAAIINDINTAIEATRETVDKHNHKSRNFTDEIEKAKAQLELHYIADAVQSHQYFDKRKEIQEQAETKSALMNSLKVRNVKIVNLENSLSNESLGAEEFNASLHRFLGRRDLGLRFNPKERGYEILRYGSERVLDNLSEGEKTAIAFVYFITKLKENGNNIGETIVVVDDPVSSFDSNHLFHAYSFLKNNCNKASQLFVLTHNFTYFKLVRDWFSRDSRNKKHKGNPRASFYTIETSTTTPRYSTIKNADDSLITYNSEYHFIFSKLYKLKDNSALSGEDALLTANLSRKLLESFFSFKFPKQRSDLAQLLDRGVRSCKNTDEITKDKIYKFINKYSHSDAIVTNEDHADNLLGESHNIIASIFTWMEEVDKTHYDEMVKVVDPS